MECLERSVQEFVDQNLQEGVFVTGGNDSVCIKAASKYASKALASLWIAVLQNENNYPLSRVPYSYQREAQGKGKVIVRVDDVTLTVFSGTGTLMIQGRNAQDWFLTNFQSIIDAYLETGSDTYQAGNYSESQGDYGFETGCGYHQSQGYGQYHGAGDWTDQRNFGGDGEDYYEDWEDDQGACSRDWAGGDQVYTSGNGYEEDGAEDVTDLLGQMSLNMTDEEALARAIQLSLEEAQIRKEKQLSQQQRTSCETDSQNGDNDKLEVMLIGTSLQNHLDRLQTPCLKDGPLYIYRLWKSLINHWFCDKARKVYIVTPFMDADRLTDICLIALNSQRTATLGAIYVRVECNRDQKLTAVKQSALQNILIKDKQYIQEQIFRKIVVPVKKFHAKFIAAVRGSETEVLVTSANFHADHFVYTNLETVQFIRMETEAFWRNMLMPMSSSVQVQK